jgi:hypothetical protein
MKVDLKHLGMKGACVACLESIVAWPEVPDDNELRLFYIKRISEAETSVIARAVELERYGIDAIWELRVLSQHLSVDAPHVYLKMASIVHSAVLNGEDFDEEIIPRQLASIEYNYEIYAKRGGQSMMDLSIKLLRASRNLLR